MTEQFADRVDAVEFVAGHLRQGPMKAAADDIAAAIVDEWGLTAAGHDAESRQAGPVPGAGGRARTHLEGARRPLARQGRVMAGDDASEFLGACLYAFAEGASDEHRRVLAATAPRLGLSGGDPATRLFVGA